MVDAHAHLDKYGESLPRALAQIRERSILTLAVSMDTSSYVETRRIAQSEPLVLPSFGVHPWEAPRFAGQLESLDPFLEESPILGEIGLDHFFVKDEAEYPAQEAVFQYFLEAAERHHRIINLHTTGAEAEVLESLEGRALPGMIIHWYSGPLELVDSYLSMGAYFTVGVEVLRSEHIRELAGLIPAERLLTETDNPGGWQWMEGEQGFPELLDPVEIALGEVRGVGREALSGQVRRNMDMLLESGGIDLSGTLLR